MRLARLYSPWHWEFGPGVMIGHHYTDRITGFPAYTPWVLTFAFGPWTFELEIGKRIDYME